MLEAEKGRVRKDFERREGLIETKKKIEYSKQLNASRIKVPIPKEAVLSPHQQQLSSAAAFTQHRS